MSSDVVLSIAAMHRIMKKAGDYRVSESAYSEMTRVLEGIGIEIGKEALEFTTYAGRKTMRGKDVRIAAEKVMDRRHG